MRVFVHCVMLLLLCRMWFDLIFNSQLFESVSELGHASIRRATRCSCSLCLLQRMLCQVRCTSPRRLQPVLCPVKHTCPIVLDPLACFESRLQILCHCHSMLGATLVFLVAAILSGLGAIAASTRVRPSVVSILSHVGTRAPRGAGILFHTLLHHGPAPTPSLQLRLVRFSRSCRCQGSCAPRRGELVYLPLYLLCHRPDDTLAFTLARARHDFCHILPALAQLL